VSFFAAIGRDPQYLKLAVVNDEMNHNDYDNCKNLTDYPFSMLSCRYLFHLDKKIILQVNKMIKALLVSSFTAYSSLFFYKKKN